MAPKTCYFFLVGFAMVVSSMTATCVLPSGSIDAVNVRDFGGNWYAQGMYIGNTENPKAVYCMKSEYKIVEGDAKVTSTIKAPCGSSNDTEVTLYPRDDGQLLLLREGQKDMNCYLITGKKEEHHLLYCCSDCNNSICETLLYYTRDADLKADLLAEMNKKAVANGLQRLTSKVRMVSGNACFRK